jgi:hypothetical protein
MKKQWVVLWALALLMSWSVVVKADSLGTMGASSRGTAMGGAMIGIADGWEAVYYNSSALALSRNSSSFQYSMVGGEVIENKDDILADGFALKYGINHRLLRERIGLGLIVGTSNAPGGGMSLDVTSLIGDMFGGGGGGGWQRYSDAMPIILSTGVGIRVTDWLSFGITASEKPSLISMSNWQFHIVDPVVLAALGIDTRAWPSSLSDMSLSVGSDPSEDVVTGFNVTLRPVKYLSFGYKYTPEMWSRIKLRVELVGGMGSILNPSWHFVFDMRTPAQVETTVIGGAAHVPIPWNDGLLTLAYAYEQQNWDGFYARSLSYDFNAIDRFSPTYFSNKVPRDPGLENVDFERYGLEYAGDATPLLFWKMKNLSNARFVVRGGYYQWETPQPEVTESWQWIMTDSDADVYSFGMGFGFDRKKKARPGGMPPPRLEFDFHFQQTDLEDRDYRIDKDEWGGISLNRYLVRTEGSITNYGFQVTWLK